MVGLSQSAGDIEKFQNAILDFYAQQGRDFPWRSTCDAYAILVSEFMLQQTQTERVCPKYAEWLHRFPSLESLACAPFAHVLQAWIGLGYNRRARFLHQSAKLIVERYCAVVPDDPSELKKLPGVGDYTAAAVACFAYNKATVFLETNIRAVFIRFFFPDTHQVSDRELLSLVRCTLYEENPRRWYYALMDYGAVLKRKITNPNRRSKHYVKQSPFEGSLRQVRGAVLREIGGMQHAVREKTLFAKLSFEHERLSRALDSLVSEGLVVKTEAGYSIAD